MNRLIVVRKKYKGNFTNISNNLLRFCPKDVSAHAWLLFLHLLSLGNGYSMSIEGLAKKRGESYSSIQKAMYQLQKAGYAKKELIGKHEYEWTVIEP